MKRPLSDNPCKDCRYAEEWDYGDDYIEYRCHAGVPDDEGCDGEPERYSDYELYRRENPYD